MAVILSDKRWNILGSLKWLSCIKAGINWAHRNSCHALKKKYIGLIEMAVMYLRINILGSLSCILEEMSWPQR
jgi:hypothetical protein